MSNSLCKTAESLIFDLKQSIADVCKNYGDRDLLHSLRYADQEYGVMQREELMEVMKLLAYLKKQVDGLSEDCLAIPRELRVSDAGRQKASARGA